MHHVLCTRERCFPSCDYLIVKTMSLLHKNILWSKCKSVSLHSEAMFWFETKVNAEHTSCCHPLLSLSSCTAYGDTSQSHSMVACESVRLHCSADCLLPHGKAWWVIYYPNTKDLCSDDDGHRDTSRWSLSMDSTLLQKLLCISMLFCHGVRIDRESRRLLVVLSFVHPHYHTRQLTIQSQSLLQTFNNITPCPAHQFYQHGVVPWHSPLKHTRALR